MSEPTESAKKNLPRVARTRYVYAPITCECGNVISYGNIQKHRHTKKHMEIMEHRTPEYRKVRELLNKIVAWIGVFPDEAPEFIVNRDEYNEMILPKLLSEYNFTIDTSSKFLEYKGHVWCHSISPTQHLLLLSTQEIRERLPKTVEAPRFAVHKVMSNESEKTGDITLYAAGWYLDPNGKKISGIFNMSDSEGIPTLFENKAYAMWEENMNSF